MLVKEADDQSLLLEELERRASGTGQDAKRAKDELRIRRAGIKGESESAYLIDFEFARSSNWAVIHDLRIEHDGRVAQLDHLMINRWMDFYVLESKHFHAGFKITDDGEFLQWDDFRRRFVGMSCPLTQNIRHIEVLKDLVSSIELPERLGFRITPNFHSLVLVSPRARIDRSKQFDSSRVIKADHLKKRIWRDIDDDSNLFGVLKSVAKIVSSETLEHLARQLVARHQPRVPAQAAVTSPTPKLSAKKASHVSSQTTTGRPSGAPPATREGPSCKSCGMQTGEIKYGKYGYYFACQPCGANTAIRFSCRPGHKPRLRKQAEKFFRECADCGTSHLYFENRPNG